jgi:transglutaminase-like putative cysteine protease
VIAAERPDTTARAGENAIKVLLADGQVRFGPDGDEYYVESEFRLNSAAALQVVGALSPTWDPRTETLTLHRFDIVRGGQVIDLLDGGKKVTVVRREKDLELATIDGRLTAVVQPEGVQVGDVIDIAFTLKRHDPVLKGLSQGIEPIRFVGVADHVRLRVLWPTAKPIRWRITDATLAPTVRTTSAGSELTLDLRNYEIPKPPNDAPSRFGDLDELEFTEFQDWAGISALMAPLYAKAETLAPDSPVRLEAKRIADASPDLKARAEAALRLVQDQVRYAFIGPELGGFTPADADVTWTRRFGDCKGKTVLLVTLLRELGIEAQPVMVNTLGGDGLDRRLPTLNFNHVLVRARIGGKDYWLDATRQGDRALDDIQTPQFHWGLPVQASAAQLVRLEPAPLARPEFESLLRIDASAGVDAPAVVHAERLFRGDDAVLWQTTLSAAGRDEADRALRDYWRRRLSWVDVKSVSYAFDDASREMRFVMDGAGPLDWFKSGTEQSFRIDDSSLGYDASFTRDPGPDQDAPYRVLYPTFNQWTVVLTLPDKGRGFGVVESQDVDVTLAGVRYQRRTRMQDGVVTMVATDQSIEPEFPATEAAADAAALRKLASVDVAVARDMPAPGLGEAEASDSLPTPTDAAGFNLRGAAFFGRHDYVHAIADFAQAAKLDPTSAKYAYNLGAAHAANGQDDLALADLDRALRLNPTDTMALVGRARLHLQLGDAALARDDFEAAAKAAPAGADEIRQRELYALEAAGRYDVAVTVYDGLIAKTPTAQLYHDRCWERAKSGQDLAAALADCDAALGCRPVRRNFSTAADLSRRGSAG